MLEAFLPDTLKTILGGVIATAIVLSWFAHRFQHVGWLRFFRLPAPDLSEEEQARRRQSANRQAAIEIILAGLVLPLLYAVATVMMFNDFRTVPTLIVGACSVACIGLGIWILSRSR